jgi:GAF domain-containing protein
MRTARHRADTSTARAGLFGVRPAPGGARAAATDDQDVRTRGDATHDARLDALLGAVVSMSAELDIGSVLERFVAVACTLTGARYGAISVLGEHGRQEEFVQQGIGSREAALIGHLPDGGGVLGHLVHHPQTLRLHDLGDHPASTGFPPHHPPMGGLLGVPVRDRGAVFGNLYLTDKVDPAGDLVDFTARDEQVVEALAAAAAVSLGHARARRRARVHATWLETGVGATARLTGDLPRDEAVADVLAQVRATAKAQEAILFGAARSGLANLAARASSRQGTFELTAPTDCGSELQWCVPLPRAVPGPAVSTNPVLL